MTSRYITSRCLHFYNQFDILLCIKLPKQNSAMTVKFAISLWLLLHLFDDGTCSDCTYIRGEYNYDDQVYYGYHGICSGVTSDLYLDPPPPNASQVFVLYIEGNSTIPQLRSSAFSSLTNLRYIALKKLSIETLSPGAFNGLGELTDLSLNINRIRELPVGVFSELRNLRKLFMARNEITAIPFGVFDNLLNLEYLELSNNQINRIDSGALSNLVALQTLDLDDNKVGVLQANLFRNMEALSRLFISNNPLSYWQEVGFGDKVTVIRAENTSLRQFTPNLARLQLHSLILSNGALEDFDFGLVGPVYDILNLQNNHISTLRNFGSTDAYVVNLDRNYLREVLDIPTKVVALFLSNNDITRIGRSSDPRDYKIEYLDLSNNNINSATCLGFPQLKVLNLRNNEISIVDDNSFSNCNNVEDLFLSSNMIYNIEPDTFTRLTALTTLDISDNILKTFDPRSVAGLTRLQTLFLHNNEISGLDGEGLVRNAPNLSRVRLGGNTFSCQEVLSLLSILESRGGQITDAAVLRSICNQNLIEETVC